MFGMERLLAWALHNNGAVGNIVLGGIILYFIGARCAALFVLLGYLIWRNNQLEKLVATK